MTGLHKFLVMPLLLGTGGAALAQLPIQPLDLPAIQGQYNSAIQQQNFGSQLNSLQLQQGMTQDRIRELDLFRPQQPYGATTVFQPQAPVGVILPRTQLPPPAPPPSPAPKAD